MLVARARRPAMTHPSAAEAEAQRGSGAAGAPGFGSGRRQGTVGPGLAWGQESGLKPQLGHSLAGRFPGRGDRCLPSRPGRRWAPERQGHRGCGWPPRARSGRGAAHTHEAGAVGEVAGLGSWAGHLSSGCGLLRSGAQERGLGRTRWPIGMYALCGGRRQPWKAGCSGPASGRGGSGQQRNKGGPLIGQVARLRPGGGGGNGGKGPPSGPVPCPSQGAPVSP